MTRLLIALTAIAVVCTALDDPFASDAHPRSRRQSKCTNLFSAACRAERKQAGISGGRRGPTFASAKCDYSDQRFWLIPRENDNTTCTRPEVFENGVKVRVYNDTVTIEPEVIILPSCFNISFDLEITRQISDVPRSMLAKNEFQLYEFPEIEKMQCQNASNNGCGGYGNNCNYCDMCDSLQELDTDAAKRQDRVAAQFQDLTCPNEQGKIYRVKREFCFNDWAEMDKDSNCKLDFLETLEKDSKPNPKTGKTDSDTLKGAWDIINKKGFSTLIARFYLAHNETDSQTLKRKTKEAQITQHWTNTLNEKRRAGWQIGDTEFESFKGWYVQVEKDKWHKEKFLPWLLHENQLACLKVSFTVCDKQPIKTGDTQASDSWWRPQSGSGLKCPKS